MKIQKKNKITENNPKNSRSYFNSKISHSGISKTRVL